MPIEELYQLYLKNPKIYIDSRQVTTGSIFFALRGENFNGNQFAGKALEKCEYAVIADKEYYLDERTILVENTLDTLQSLANIHRRKLGLKIIALTGSNGKTTTKELIRNVLSKKYQVTATEGNLNNHIGVPLTLLNMNSSTEIGVVEMGANHMKEIETLCNIAEPDYGLVTNIGHAHIEGFGSFDNVIRAKSELYDYLMKNNKAIFQNTGNQILTKQTRGYKVIPYDSSQALEKLSNTVFLSFKYDHHTINTQLIGNYNYENALAAITIGKYFNVPMDAMIDAIEQYQPSNIRSQFKETKFNSLILDAYNANPSSMKAALENFYQQNFENKVLILGDMFELGKTSSNEHENIIQLAQNHEFSNSIFIGELFSKFSGNYPFQFFKSTDEIIIWLKTNPIKDKTILIKGSRGMQLERIIEYL
jgi:UDP-N-acetylmuramoyl-tripeptide--D-alanyl-D-alanine ligase